MKTIIGLTIWIIALGILTFGFGNSGSVKFNFTDGRVSRAHKSITAIRLLLLVLSITITIGLPIRGIYYWIRFAVEYRPPPCIETYKTTKLVSLQDGTKTSGFGVSLFYLGVGTVNENEYFYFYKEVGNSYQLDKLENGKNIFISEWDKPEAILKENQRCEIFKKTFYVPKGSIKRDFSLDAKLK